MKRTANARPLTFVIREHLNHEWTDELVGFPWPHAAAPDVCDAAGQSLASQVSAGKVWFKVAHLPALGRVRFTARPAAAATPPVPCTRAVADGATMVLSNGAIELRVPGTQEFAPDASGQRLPAPVLGIRRANGPWIGRGELRVSPDQTVSGCRFETLEEGPLWGAYALTYTAGSLDYRIEYRLDAGCAHVALREHSRLCHDAEWAFDVHPGLAPARAAFGHHRTWGKTRVLDLDYSGKQHLGDLQAPDQNIHFFVDDFDAYTFLAETEALGLAAQRDGDWTFLPQNPVHMRPLAGPRLELSAACKAGVRCWALFLASPAGYAADGDYFTTPAAALRRKYETTLDWVKDQVLEWKEERPDSQRPFAACTKEDIARARRLFRDDPAFRQYAEFLDRDAEMVLGQYDAGGHYPLNDERREDPVCAWLAKPDPKIAEIIQRGLLEGLRIRVDAFLGPQGHRAGIITSINLGRTLRPFLQIYDILAPHLPMTARERKYFMAAAAFLASKADDRHYWNAEAIVLHSDHPRSSHRTAWFPSRESDWCTYNVDTAPHNFHIDVYTGMGAVGLVFPSHPRSRAWIEQTLAYIERELDNWIFRSGAFIESATYTIATLHWWAPYFAMLKNARIRNYFVDERFQRLCYALVRLQGPYDRRIRRHSYTIMGDAMYPSSGANTLAWIANLAREDAPFSAALMGAWDRAARQLNAPGQQGLSTYDALYIDPSLPVRLTKGLPSEHFDGLGLILRDRHGTPNETFFFIKCGKIYSHFHYDEGAFFVFADQVPLLDEYGIQYGSGTDQDGKTVGGSMPQCHNGISFSDTPTDRECYNRGNVTCFRPTPWADYAVCEMPVHLLHMKPDMSLWGFQGEEAPYGWWRRHILYIKPHGFFFYDELESEFPATLDLNFKADRFEAVPGAGLSRVYKGRYGTDIPVCINAPTDGIVREGKLDMKASVNAFPKFSTMEKVSADLKDTFYNQLSMHVRAGAGRDFSWAFGWAKPEAAPRLQPLGAGIPGSRLQAGDTVTQAIVAPWLKPAVSFADAAMRYAGWAGAVRTAPGQTELMQLSGTLIAAAGGPVIEGDGPFRAVADGRRIRELAIDGRARWLTFRNTPVRSARIGAQALKLEKAAGGGVRVSVPAGAHRIALG